MLGADADPTVSFFCLLKADRGGVVEAACARLAALPASLAKAPPALTFDALDAALATLTTAAGISSAGLPPDAARQARLAAHGYRCEAHSLASAGREAASLLFLGRALEAAGIAAALSALALTHGADPLTPPRLRRLVAASAPALLADARAWLGRVADAFAAHAAAPVTTAASPTAHELIAAAASSSPPPSPRTPPSAHGGGGDDREPATAALKSDLLALAGGRGTLPHAPPPATRVGPF